MTEKYPPAARTAGETNTKTGKRHSGLGWRGGIAIAAATAALTSGCSFSLQSEAAPKPARHKAEPVSAYSNQLKFTDHPDIIKLSDPLPNPRGTEKVKPQGSTLHWWGFDADGDINTLRFVLKGNSACGDTGCSVQYAVTEKGKIYQMMSSPLDYAYQAGVANPTTIGVEIEGLPEDFAVKGPRFNKAKFEAVVDLELMLVKDFHMPITGGFVAGDVTGIHGHYEYNDLTNPPGTKSDPGKAYTKAVVSAVESMQPQNQ